jgi:hypothetical protein
MAHRSVLELEESSVPGMVGYSQEILVATFGGHEKVLILGGAQLAQAPRDSPMALQFLSKKCSPKPGVWRAEAGEGHTALPISGDLNSIPLERL